MSFVRVALVTVPPILLLGMVSGALAGSSASDPWFAGLAKPAIMPPDWVIPVVWTALYILIGIALALVVSARGAGGRTIAIGLFAVQFALNLAWAPTFFGAHAIGAAFAIALLMIVATVVTILAFARVRPRAAALMLPYLAWICFAAWLTHSFETLDPAARTLAPGHASTQVAL